MKKLSDVDVRGASEAGQISRASHMCASPGCPMYGTIADAPGAERRYCRFHYGTHGQPAALITSVLRNRRDLVDEVHRLRRLSAYGGPEVPMDIGQQIRAADTALAAAVKEAAYAKHD